MDIITDQELVDYRHELEDDIARGGLLGSAAASIKKLLDEGVELGRRRTGQLRLVFPAQAEVKYHDVQPCYHPGCHASHPVRS